MAGYAVGVEVVEESADDGVGLWDVHFLGMEFGHLSGVDASEVWPASLEDQLVDMDGSGGGDIMGEEVVGIVCILGGADGHGIVEVGVVLFACDDEVAAAT